MQKKQVTDLQEKLVTGKRSVPDYKTLALANVKNKREHIYKNTKCQKKLSEKILISMEVEQKNYTINENRNVK